jgi:hypothetical protein
MYYLKSGSSSIKTFKHKLNYYLVKNDVKFIQTAEEDLGQIAISDVMSKTSLKNDYTGLVLISSLQGKD